MHEAFHQGLTTAVSTGHPRGRGQGLHDGTWMAWMLAGSSVLAWGSHLAPQRSYGAMVGTCTSALDGRWHSARALLHSLGKATHETLLSAQP